MITRYEIRDTKYEIRDTIFNEYEAENDTNYFIELIDLNDEKDKINLFDCGYRDIKIYSKIVKSDNHFVTKLG